MILYDDNYFMRRAIEEAKIALQKKHLNNSMMQKANNF